MSRRAQTGCRAAAFIGCLGIAAARAYIHRRIGRVGHLGVQRQIVVGCPHHLEHGVFGHIGQIVTGAGQFGQIVRPLVEGGGFRAAIGCQQGQFFIDRQVRRNVPALALEGRFLALYRTRIAGRQMIAGH